MAEIKRPHFDFGAGTAAVRTFHIVRHWFSPIRPGWPFGKGQAGEFQPQRTARRKDKHWGRQKLKSENCNELAPACSQQ
jgi:hypothetical protein